MTTSRENMMMNCACEAGKERVGRRRHWGQVRVTVKLAQRQIRLMTDSHKAQREKLATGGGRETTAEKPDNN